MQVIPIATASDLMARLRLSNSEWTSAAELNSDWIFRGHGDSAWRLIPTSRRLEKRQFSKIFNFLDGITIAQYANTTVPSFFGGTPFDEYHKRLLVLQIRYESILIKQFAATMNDMGYPVPGGAIPRDYCLKPGWQWQEPQLRTLVALAQHHGMPTPVLDWTLNPLKAAFFAAADEGCDENTEMAIWAWKPITLETIGGDFNVYEVPRSEILNLHAQEGRMSWDSQSEIRFAESGNWRPMETSADFGDSLRKFVIPGNQRWELLRLLAAEGIRHHVLMPSYDSITKSTRILLNIEASAPIRPL